MNTHIFIGIRKCEQRDLLPLVLPCNAVSLPLQQLHSQAIGIRHVPERVGPACHNSDTEQPISELASKLGV